MADITSAEGKPVAEDGEAKAQAMVKCVVLRAGASKPGSEEELEFDPSAPHVQLERILGGAVTVVARDDIVLVGLHGCVDQRGDGDENGEQGVKTETDTLAAEDAGLNPHQLPPPFHDNIKVRGDIVILKIKKEDDDEKPVDGSGVEGNEAAASSREAGNTDSGFQLNKATLFSYTKDEYLQFTATTTNHSQKAAVEENAAEGIDDKGDDADNDDEDEDDDDEEDDGDDGDREFIPGEDMEELTEEEERSAMLNIVMSELLRKFREENGRGPNSREVLEIRSSVAEQLGMEVTGYDASQEEEKEEASGDQEQTNGKKRAAEDTEHDSGPGPPRKRVKFNSNLESVQGEGDDNNQGDEQHDDNNNQGNEDTLDQKPEAKAVVSQESDGDAKSG